MTRILTAILVLFLAVPALAAPPAAGMITRVQGAVKVLPAGSKTGEKADLLRPLLVGDRLEVPAGGLVAVVIYADGHQETATGKTTATVGARGLEGTNVIRARSSQALASLHTEATLGGARGAISTRHHEPTLPMPEVLLTPDASVENGKPVFGLPPLAGQGGLLYLGIRDFAGKVLVEEKLTTGSLTWTPTVALPPGRYQVLLFEESGNVLARRVILVGETDARIETLLTELQSGDPEDPTPFLLASLVLEKEGLTEGALEAAEMALALHPSPALLRHCSGLARRLGRATEAAAFAKLAVTLEAGSAP